jgi:tetratricopeptide (TPR) repeat protein
MRDFGVRISDVGFRGHAESGWFPKSDIRHPKSDIPCLFFVLLALFGGNLFGQAATGNEKFQAMQYAEAVTAYESVPQAERNPGLLNRLAVSYHMLNRLKEAEIVYRQAIKLDSRFADANNNLAVLYYAQFKFSNAERQARRALEINPENVISRLNLRASRYARENSRSARMIAADLAKDNPILVARAEGDLLQAVMLMPQKDLNAASQAERRGDTFFARKMYEDAIVEYRNAIAVDRYNASTLNRLGLVYHQSQKLPEAERYYREAVKQNPYYLEAMNNIGTLEYVRKRYERALDQYNRALKLRPESPTILINVGACLFAMERYDEGLKAYQHALTIDPKVFERSSGSGFGTLIQTSQRTDSLLNFNLAKLFATNGDKERAISYLYKAVEEGFKDLEKIKTEPAFALLAEDTRYQQLIDTMLTPR